MNSYFNYARDILLGETLEAKMSSPAIAWDDWRAIDLPKAPGRQGVLAFSDRQMKFPKSSRLNETDKKAMALHSFANHELLAIEMMAAAILIYPHATEEEIRFKRGIVTALKDEQKHLALYIGRINELGYAFGDFPLNDFFWRQMEKLKTPAQYVSMMALTFEAANLDFAQHYSKIFRELGDEKTSDILNIVLEDEVTHVAFGSHWMKRWRADKSLWEYYRESLPWPLTPARSKGISYDSGLHARAMSDEGFMQDLNSFHDDFPITKRK